MFDALFRQIKDRLFVSVAKMLDIPPNLITVFSLILGGLTVGFVLQKLYLAALMFWFLNRIFDGLDGAIARIHQRQTDLGGISISYLTLSSMQLFPSVWSLVPQL